MTFFDQLETDLDVFFNGDEFAETATYNGAAVLVVKDDRQEPDSGARKDLAVISVKKTDVPDPAYRDAVVVGGDTWTVSRVLGGDAHVWSLEIARNERPVW